jgi:hypothetical protein
MNDTPPPSPIPPGGQHAPIVLRAILCVVMVPVTFLAWQSMSAAHLRLAERSRQAEEVRQQLAAHAGRSTGPSAPIARERVDLTGVIGDLARRTLTQGTIAEVTALSPDARGQQPYLRCVTMVEMAGVKVSDALRLAEELQSARPSVTVTKVSLSRSSTVDQWGVSMALEDRVGRQGAAERGLLDSR